MGTHSVFIEYPDCPKSIPFSIYKKLLAEVQCDFSDNKYLWQTEATQPSGSAINSNKKAVHLAGPSRTEAKSSIWQQYEKGCRVNSVYAASQRPHNLEILIAALIEAGGVISTSLWGKLFFLFDIFNTQNTTWIQEVLKRIITYKLCGTYWFLLMQK